MDRKRLVCLVVCVMVLFISTSTLVADDESMRNILVKFTITHQNSDGSQSDKVYELMTIEGHPTELLAGWRVPIVSRQVADSGNLQAASVGSSFIYQNVGVTIQVETMTLGKERVRLNGQIELSHLEQDTDTGPVATPKIGTFHQMFQAILTDGEPVTVSRAPKMDRGSIAIVAEVIMPD